MTDPACVLNADQVAFLEAADVTDRVHQVCDHEHCHDHFAHFGIEVVTALSQYGVRGDQFAAIVMDMISSLRKVMMADPELVMHPNLTSFVHNSVAMAALSFRNYKENNGSAPPRSKL